MQWARDMDHYAHTIRKQTNVMLLQLLINQVFETVVPDLQIKHNSLRHESAYVSVAIESHASRRIWPTGT